MGVCGFLSFRGQGRPVNRAQLIFRLSLGGAALLGVVVLAATKAVLKRRSA